MSDWAPLLFRYEHLVNLNDAVLPTPALSRATVWSGLCARAIAPQLYDESISACEIQGGAPLLMRSYRRHSTTIKDEVRLDPLGQVTFVTLIPAEFRGSALRIRIEEPDDSSLLLHFVYELRGRGAAPAEPEAAALRGAYTNADAAFVARLRELAAG